MPKIDLEKEREYVWKYFTLHADQRLKTFHFYVLISSLLIGAIITASKYNENQLYISILSALNTFIAFIFWKLDIRNRHMIKTSEEILKDIESFILKKSNDKLKITPFLNEEKKTNSIKSADSFFNIHLSYTNCFNSVFLVFGSGSFILFIYIIQRYINFCNFFISN